MPQLGFLTNLGLGARITSNRATMGKMITVNKTIIAWPDQCTAVLIISPEESQAIILTFDSSKYLLMVSLSIISLD